MIVMAGRRSKLELYIQTMDTLAIDGPARLSRLTLKTKINCGPLKAILSELEGKELVEERKFRSSVFYAATPKAKSILSKYDEIVQIIPLG